MESSRYFSENPQSRYIDSKGSKKGLILQKMQFIE